MTFLVYLPALLNPGILLARGNDLQEQFWPVFYFIREKFLETHTLPFWNNLFLSGTPLLPDPQFSLFYPPNWLFILLPTDLAFIIWLILHTFLGGIFFFLLSRSVFRLSLSTSLVIAVLYITTPKLGGYLEAGHYGLVGTLTWLPLVILSCFKLTLSKKIKWALFLGISFAALFFLHTVTLTLTAASSFLLVLTISILKKSNLLKDLLMFLLGVITSIGLTAIALFPQIEWLPQTTRFLLLQDRDVYPKWSSAVEFITSSISPLLSKNPHYLDTEKWLFLGIVPIILAFIGFVKLKTLYKILVAISLFAVVLIASNNVSPLSNLLLFQDWFVLQRVATRIWFVPLILTLTLAGFALEKIRKNKLLFALAATLALLESTYIFWLAINKPIQKEADRFVIKEVYEFLKKDEERFRVFCTNRCLSQKDSAIHNLELVEGYNTLQQRNYYKQAWQLTGAYWNYYTLSIPPIGTYTFEKPQPDPVSLGEFNTKYIISPYELTDKRFSLENKFGEYLLYQNTSYLPRAYFQRDDQKPGNEAKILKYTPNFIKVDTSSNQSSRLVLAEVWSPGWNGYLNGKEKVKVQEKPNTLRLVNIKPDTNFVEFRYEPKSFLIGKYITLATLLFLLIYLVRLLDIVSIIKRNTPITKASKA